MRPDALQGQGRLDELSLPLSHLRVYKDAPESELAAVTYELAADEHRSRARRSKGQDLHPDRGRRCVRRGRHAPRASPAAYPILPGVTKLPYRYCRKTRDGLSTAEHTWDSDTEEPKNTYPDLIKLQLEVKGQQKMFFEGTYEFRPEVPLHGLNPST